MSGFVSWCRRSINEVSVGFVDILCQHDRRETGRLVLEDDLPRVIGCLLMKPGLRIKKKKVLNVFILGKSFPVGVTSWNDAKIKSAPYWFSIGSQASNPFDLKYSVASEQVQRFWLILT